MRPIVAYVGFRDTQTAAGYRKDMYQKHQFVVHQPAAAGRSSQMGPSRASAVQHELAVVARNDDRLELQ